MTLKMERMTWAERDAIRWYSDKIAKELNVRYPMATQDKLWNQAFAVRMKEFKKKELGIRVFDAEELLRYRDDS